MAWITQNSENDRKSDCNPEHTKGKPLIKPTIMPELSEPGTVACNPKSPLPSVRVPELWPSLLLAFASYSEIDCSYRRSMQLLWENILNPGPCGWQRQSLWVLLLVVPVTKTLRTLISLLPVSNLGGEATIIPHQYIHHRPPVRQSLLCQTSISFMTNRVIIASMN